MIDKEDISRLDERYMSRIDCECKVQAMSNRISEITTKLAIIEKLQERNTWLCRTILGAVIALVVATLYGIFINLA